MNTPLIRSRLFTTIFLAVLLPLVAWATPGAAEVAWFEQQLARVTDELPSTRNVVVRSQVADSASEVLTPAELERFRSFMQNHPDEYLQVRARVNSRPVAPLMVGTPPRRATAVVSGRSVNGLMQALELQRMGYAVTVVDMRPDHNRNIQWAIRQSLYDNLESIDPQLAARFRAVAGDLSESIHIDPAGTQTSLDTPGGIRPNPLRLEAIVDGVERGGRMSQGGTEMLRAPSVMTVEARRFEDTFEAFLREQPGISLVDGYTQVEEAGPDGRRAVTIRTRDGQLISDLGVPDTPILAEGANSTNSTRLRVTSFQTTEARLQIAGEVHLPGGGQMAKHYRLEKGEQMVTYTMETKGSDKMWVVGDVHASVITPDPARFPLEPGAGFTRGTSGYDAEVARLRGLFDAEKQRLTNIEFRRLASASLRIPPDQINMASIAGPFDGARGPGAFFLDSRIAQTAFVDGVQLIGDAVGNGPPTVGGGLQMAATSHALRSRELRRQLDIIERRLRTGAIGQAEADRLIAQARSVYSEGVIADTLAWIRQGIPDMYLYVQDPLEVDRIPADQPFASQYNARVDQLNEVLSRYGNMSPADLEARLRAETDPYYRNEFFLSDRETLKPGALEQYRVKNRAWAYQDFLRSNFDDAMAAWRNGEVTEPLAYMRQTLPERGPEGLRSPPDMTYVNRRGPAAVGGGCGGGAALLQAVTGPL